jgi:hypothetical protein
MKMIIVKLRIAALASLILFFVLTFAGVSGAYKSQISMVQNVLILLSFVLFIFILILQVYRFYVNNNYKADTERNLPD